jgi:hypothetical protein
VKHGRSNGWPLADLSSHLTFMARWAAATRQTAPSLSLHCLHGRGVFTVGHSFITLGVQATIPSQRPIDRSPVHSICILHLYLTIEPQVPVWKMDKICEYAFAIAGPNVDRSAPPHLLLPRSLLLLRHFRRISISETVH